MVKLLDFKELVTLQEALEEIGRMKGELRMTINEEGAFKAQRAILFWRWKWPPIGLFLQFVDVPPLGSGAEYQAAGFGSASGAGGWTLYRKVRPGKDLERAWEYLLQAETRWWVFHIGKLKREVELRNDPPRPKGGASRNTE